MRDAWNPELSGFLIEIGIRIVFNYPVKPTNFFMYINIVNTVNYEEKGTDNRSDRSGRLIPG